MHWCLYTHIHMSIHRYIGILMHVYAHLCKYVIMCACLRRRSLSLSECTLIQPATILAHLASGSRSCQSHLRFGLPNPCSSPPSPPHTPQSLNPAMFTRKFLSSRRYHTVLRCTTSVVQKQIGLYLKLPWTTIFVDLDISLLHSLKQSLCGFKAGL